MAAGATTTVTPAGTTTTMHASKQAAAPANPVVAEVLAGPPTAAYTDAADAIAPDMHVDNQPKVDSPLEDLDAGMGDFLQNLHSMNSAELMMTDDVNKDDLWDMLFGAHQHPASVAGTGGQHPVYDAGGGLLGSGIAESAVRIGAHCADAPGAPLVMDGPAAGLPAVGSPGLPGLVHDALDPAMAAALTVPASVQPTSVMSRHHVSLN
jgi:hypothetical protein